MFKGIKKYLAERKKRKLMSSCYIWYNYQEGGSGKGSDIWGNDWPIPVAEKFEWHFYDDCQSHCQYITTKLTDYILWFIPFSYAEYVYELPGGTFGHNELTTKRVVEMIDYLDHWNWHTDEVYWEDGYDGVYFENGHKYTENVTYKLGNNDYHFIRSK